jgi:uncharacterized protein (DUF983 family)
MFGNINLKAEIVNGTCPTCSEKTLLVSLTSEIYRCITCGTDLKQHINGKISYIPHLVKTKDMKLDIITNG